MSTLVAMAIGETEKKVLHGLWKNLPSHMTSVLGSEVALDRPKYSEVGLTETGYVASLSLERPHNSDLFLGFDKKSAIVCSGLLVMMQEKVIREHMEKGDISQDDLDAMGECINQFGSVFNEVLRDQLGAEHHVVFNGGAEGMPDAHEPYAATGFLRVSGDVKFGDLHSGTLEIVIPRKFFDPEAAQAAPEDLDVQLSPEEQAALRAAAQEGFDNADTLAVLVPVERERSAWTELLGNAGVSFELVSDVFTAQKMVDRGDAMAILIDADACPGAGVPALVQLRGSLGAHVRMFVAASRPTRTHLVTCLAGGAASYLVKPVDALELQDRLSIQTPDNGDAVPAVF